MRTRDQQLWDLFALLVLFDQTNRLSKVDGNLKIQKLVFLYELAGIRQDLMVAHFKFFRYTWGPYSKVLASDVELLETQGFVTGRNRHLTKRAHFVLEYFGDAVAAEGKGSVELIVDTAKRYAKMSGPRLVDLVYGLAVPVYDLGNESHKVKAIEQFVDILDPVNTPGLREIRPFQPDILEQLDAELAMKPEDLDPRSKSYRTTIEQALQRLQGLTA